MKKLIAAVCLSALVLSAAAGQTNDVVMLNVNKYAGYFFKDSKVSPGEDYVLDTPKKDRDTFAPLSGSVRVVDAPLEFALLSYYSPALLNIRPPEAAAMLPANSRTSEIKLAAATYKELQEVRFLEANNRDRIGRYEAMLKFITDRNRVTQSEINSALRAGIADTVDEEFGKISFLQENYSANSRFSYDVVLTRNAKTGQYTIHYDRASVQNDDKELNAASLETLLAAMRNSGDFVPTAIDQVRAQAALIPAVVLSDNALNEAKSILANFYANPNSNTYGAVKDIAVLYLTTYVSTGKAVYSLSTDAYSDVLKSLNVYLNNKVFGDAQKLSITNLTQAQQQRLIQTR